MASSADVDQAAATLSNIHLSPPADDRIYFSHLEVLSEDVLRLQEAYEQDDVDLVFEIRSRLKPDEQKQWKYPKYRPRAQAFYTLPDRYRLTPENPSPPTLHFGIPVSAPQILDYGVSKGVVREDYSIGSIITYRYAQVVKRLSRSCGYELTLKRLFFTTMKYAFVISLYSNYNYHQRQLGREEELAVFNKIKDKLQLDSDVPVGWFFDSDDPWRPGMPE